MIPDHAGVIHGCYSRINGQLRVVKMDRQCRRSERPINWNEKGKPGPPGPPGGGAAPVAIAGGGQAVTPGPLTRALERITLTTEAASDVMVFGHAHTFRLQCDPSPPDTLCRVDFGLFIDGRPVPNSGLRITDPINEVGRIDPADDVFGVLPDVPAGTHEVVFGYSTVSGNPGALTQITESRIGAIASPR